MQKIVIWMILYNWPFTTAVLNWGKNFCLIFQNLDEFFSFLIVPEKAYSFFKYYSLSRITQKFLTLVALLWLRITRKLFWGLPGTLPLVKLYENSWLQKPFLYVCKKHFYDKYAMKSQQEKDFFHVWFTDNFEEAYFSDYVTAFFFTALYLMRHLPTQRYSKKLWRTLHAMEYYSKNIVTRETLPLNFIQE